MMTPYITIDLQKIEHNARTIVGLCKEHGIEVSGVTKVTCGHSEVANAMLRGGVSSIADSRLQNIQRLKDAGSDANYLLLRIPALSEVHKVVELVDVSLNSELIVIEGLSKSAQRLNKIHEVVLMVDLGDLREGAWQDDLVSLVLETIILPGVRIKGIGTNLACFGGVVPSEQNMNRLVELANEIEQTFMLKLEWISGINSSGLDLIAAGHMPKQINHARIGEAILLGCETTQRRPWPGTSQDAFVLHAEILELKKKPSVPVGQCSEDAFGQRPEFEDRGMIVRALLNVGREDVDVEGIKPLDARYNILGASSGYLALDVTQAAKSLRVGDELVFSLNYSALLTAMSSEYVNKLPLIAGHSARVDEV